MTASWAPGNFPGWIDGGVLALRISSFSAGLARRYDSVVFVSAWPSHSETVSIQVPGRYS